MSTAAIDSAVLDILADDVLVECVTKTLAQERKIQRAYIAGRDARSNDERRVGSNAIYFARLEQEAIKETLSKRILRLAQERAREEVAEA